MPLKLTVLTYKGLPFPRILSAEFDSHGGRIGRKPDNHLVLPDTENYLSGHHASISYKDGEYWLHDTSTNGTELLKAAVTLSNTAAVLQEGEIIRLGDYELSVQVSTDPHFLVEPDSSDIAPFFTDSVLNDIPDSGPFSRPIAAPQETRPTFIDSQPSSVFHDSFPIPSVEEIVPISAKESTSDKPDWLIALDSLSRMNEPSSELPESSISLIPDQTRSDTFDQKDFFQNQEERFNVSEPVSSEIKKTLAVDAVHDGASLNQTASNGETLSDRLLIKAFLDGAGIHDQDFLPPEQWPATMTAAGALFRSLVEGLMDILRARAEMKSEFRVSMTTIRSMDNNPLKFNPDVQSVLKLMMGPANPAFMTPDEAVSGAIDDIKNHQLAMTAGIQASLAAILSRFAPDSIERALGEGLVFGKKARCWEMYCEKYPHLASLASEEFFGDAFVEAYEKQMRALVRR